MSEGNALNDRANTGEPEQDRTLGNGDSSAMGVTVAKLCCVCGADLHGRMRYKDSAGRYWCPACNDRDQLAKQPADCPDCGGNFTRADLQEFKGAMVCATCWEKRRTSARREESRLRAIEEEMLREEQNRKKWKVRITAALIVVAVWAFIYGIIWLTTPKH